MASVIFKWKLYISRGIKLKGLVTLKEEQFSGFRFLLRVIAAKQNPVASYLVSLQE